MSYDSTKVCETCGSWDGSLCHRGDIAPFAVPARARCAEWKVRTEPLQKAEPQKAEPQKAEPQKAERVVKHKQVETDNAAFFTDELELFENQKEDVERYKNETVIPLFHEMGVGKSVVTLKIAEHKFKTGAINALLIIAPNNVHVQWHKEQIPKWLSIKYESQCLGGVGGARTSYPFYESDALHIVCVNIDTFSTVDKWKDIVEWANAMKTFIVLDEATTIKSVDSLRSQRVLYSFNDVQRRGKTIKSSVVKSVARAILTGTPVTNGPFDMWAMMEFLQPNFFGRNYYSFKNRYGMFSTLTIDQGGSIKQIPVTINAERWEQIKKCDSFYQACMRYGVSEDTYNTIIRQDCYEGPYKHADEIKRILAPIASYRLLKDCVNMPDQTYITRRVDMSTALRKCYDSMKDDLMAQHNNITATALSNMVAMIRMQQICSGFITGVAAGSDGEDIEPEAVNEWVGKSNPKLDMMYSDIAESAKPILVLTRFSCEAARIYDDLSKQYSCCLMTGWKKVGTIEEFKEGKYEIMIANIKVISRGFNLQNACSIFYYSNTFSLEDRLQSEGRIFRLGQKNTCKYVDYVYNDTVDEQVVGVLQAKKDVLDYIRAPLDVLLG